MGEPVQGFEWGGKSYRCREDAVRFYRLRQRLARGRRRFDEQYGHIRLAFSDGDVPAGMGGCGEVEWQKLLMVRSQVEAFEGVQRLWCEIQRLVGLINLQNGTFGLGLPVLELQELAVYVMAMDKRIADARMAAGRLKIPTVTEDLRKVKDTLALRRELVKLEGRDDG